MPRPTRQRKELKFDGKLYKLKYPEEGFGVGYTYKRDATKIARGVRESGKRARVISRRPTVVSWDGKKVRVRRRQWFVFVR